ncbi:hypothetical protein ATCV1_z809R [Acanthocystis turfacea chlorella virus 1]|uniref:Uncharacterized protein z809R n=1 Tax=Chlorovirus heliozoae TaxID=322019 RepID=A7KA69_9PHYC|nr:hypothetical protein ATCV1_z809R [Acanthocystis turfacea chlorella virus 1]ABT16943.1 hypothetical protein ATCV1_z809R [Acanthocystis turfacea chlorella virus 1]
MGLQCMGWSLRRLLHQLGQGQQNCRSYVRRCQRQCIPNGRVRPGRRVCTCRWRWHVHYHGRVSSFWREKPTPLQRRYRTYVEGASQCGQGAVAEARGH